jgi:hypothetical protein
LDIVVTNINNIRAAMMKPINTFVAMFDFIGFKKLRDEKETEGLYELYKKRLLAQIQHAAARRGKTIEREGQLEFIPNFGEHSIIYRVISDSILLFG